MQFKTKEEPASSEPTNAPENTEPTKSATTNTPANCVSFAAFKKTKQRKSQALGIVSFPTKIHQSDEL